MRQPSRRLIGRTASCQITYSVSGSGSWVSTSTTQVGPDVTLYPITTTAARAGITVVLSGTLAADAYDFRVQCSHTNTGAATGNVTKATASLSIIAVAA